MEQTQTLNLRVPPELAVDLRLMAEQRRVGIASAARWLLSAAIERERAAAPRVVESSVEGLRELVAAR